MSDTTLDIGVRGAREAKAVVDLVTQALRLLGSVQAANARQSGQNAAAANAQAKAFQTELNILKAALQARQQYADKVKALQDQEVANARTSADAIVKAAKLKAEGEAEAARISAAAAESRLKDAQTAAAAEIAAQERIVAAVQTETDRRIQQQQRATDAVTKSAQADVTFQQQRVDKLKATDREEARIAADKIRRIKQDIIERQKALKALPSDAPVAQRTQIKSQITGKQDELKVVQDQIRAESEARKRALQDEESILAARKKQSAQRIAAAEAELAAVTKAGRAEVRAAQETATKSIQAANKVVALREAELRKSGQLTAQVVKAGQAEIRAATAAGNAQVAAATKTANAQNKAAQAAVTAARQQVTAGQRAAAQATQTANQQAAAAQRANAALAAQQRTANAVSSGLASLRRTVLQLVAAYSGFRAIEGFIARGLRFNETIESSKLGIAALITAEANLEDSQGRLLHGTEALAAAQGLAKDQLDKLRVAGIQTTATTEELITTFEEAVGAGVSVGLTLDQIRQFSVQVAQAASAIHLPMNQLQQETRSILQGTIDRNSRIAKALQLTNAEVNLAKQQGRLVDLLNEKFKAFNIAGIESVKTFAALRSNIQDAFSVLAGRSVEPLFVQLRNAGQRALASIFNFQTAEIQGSFRGLVQGAQDIFREVGRVIAEAIDEGIKRAQELSKWFETHREQVKATAAAIGTMVETFGHMISGIVEAVRDLGLMADGTNSVIGLVRILDAIFESIRENIKFIIAALAARALITTISSIVAAVVALRGVFTGAAIGSAFGPVGTAIGGLTGLLLTGTAAYKLFTKSSKDAGIEAARTATAFEDQQQSLGELVQRYLDLRRALAQAKDGTEEQKTLQAQLSDVLAQFAKAGGPGQAYIKIIGDGTGALEAQRLKLLELQRAHLQAALIGLQSARTQLAALEAQRDAAKNLVDQVVDRQQGAGRFGPSAFNKAAQEQDKARKSLGQLDQQVDVSQATITRLEAQVIALSQAFQKLSETPAKIRPVKPVNVPTAGAADEPQFIKQARAQLDQVRAQIAAEREKNAALLAAGAIDAIENLKRERDLALQEVAAEGDLIEAQRREAQRKLEVANAALAAASQKGKGVGAAQERVQAAEDEAKALVIQEETLSAKRERILAEFNRDAADMARERAEAEADIEVRALRAEGKALDAALLQIKTETDQALGEAARKFGSFSPEVQAKVKLVIEQEAIEKSVKAIKDEIQRILETRTAEVQSITDRFQQSGKLSAQEQQQRSNLISAANQKAIQETIKLRGELALLRAEAVKLGDTAQIEAIDALAAQLSRLSVQARNVDVEMERLSDGIREASESNLAKFIQGWADATKDAGDLFHDMITGMLDDLNQLISQLLSERVVQAISGLLNRVPGPPKDQPVFGAVNPALEAGIQGLVKQTPSVLDTAQGQAAAAAQAAAATAQGAAAGVQSTAAGLQTTAAGTMQGAVLGFSGGVTSFGAAVAAFATAVATKTGSDLVKTVTGAAGAAAAGAASGGVIGRPPYGILRGGVRGKDSIPILAMPDEGFIRPQAVRFYGQELIHLLNNMQFPKVQPYRPLKFAQGGVVPGGVLTARPTTPQRVDLVVGVDEGGMLRVWRGKVGKDIVRGHISSMPRETDKILRQTTLRP